MYKHALLFGALLSALGIGLYLGTGRASVTALIPTLGFGIPLLLCGLIARKESYRMHAMHAAVLFGLLGVLGGFGMGIPKLIKGNQSAAVYGQIVMAVLSLVFVVLCIRSFVAVRKAREAAAES